MTKALADRVLSKLPTLVPFRILGCGFIELDCYRSTFLLLYPVVELLKLSASSSDKQASLAVNLHYLLGCTGQMASCVECKYEISSRKPGMVARSTKCFSTCLGPHLISYQRFSKTSPRANKSTSGLAQNKELSNISRGSAKGNVK